MNERQAEAAGYKFSGAYSHDKAEMKRRAAELREAGNKAVVVDTPPDKLSRGSRGVGYSVYWIESDANRTAREEKERARVISQLEGERAGLLGQVAALEVRLNGLRNKEVVGGQA